MDYSARWDIIEELGQGGQGKVYRVLDKEKFRIKDNLINVTKSSIINFASTQTEEMKSDAFEQFRESVLQIIRMEDPSHSCALKVLHEPKEARDSKLAETRIRNEIKAMSELNHPNLLKIFDYDLDKTWFVSQFYSKSTLNKNPLFVGEFPRALRAFRPLVEGVSRIHEKKMVHRDIKPQNIFIDHDNTLILGDFGLVFFTDEVHTRISDTFENVGSRDWMPGWAYGMKVEDVTPCFDVFSLGKVLWSMISGRPILRLWYVDKEQFNLEKMFPKNKFMSMANRLLKRCVVEEEKDCLLDAKALLEEVDRVLSLVENNAELLDPQIERQCKVCGVGKYLLRIDQGSNQLQNFGIRPTVGNSFKVFTCDHCGHFQLFLFEERKGIPPAWDKKIDLRKKAQKP